MKAWFNRALRVGLTGFGFTVFGLGLVLISVIFMLVIRWFPAKFSTKRRWLVSTVKGMSLFFISFTRLIGVSGHSYAGVEHLQTRGKIIVANHPSLVDVLYIGAKVDNLCCIVKEDLWHNPFTSYIVKLAGYIPNHSETLLDDAKSALGNGNNLLIFPEGTRNTRDDQLDFKRGAAHIALYAKAEIVPVVLQVIPRTMQKGDPWFKVPAGRFIVHIKAYSSLDSLHCNVDPQSPPTMQARQLTTFLVAFYRARVREFAVKSEIQSVTSNYEHPAGHQTP